MNDELDLPLYKKCTGMCNGYGDYHIQTGLQWQHLKCPDCKGTGIVYLPELELEDHDE